MSFNNRTPESLIPRSDSKNPATTCSGITSNGRPCRRPVASPKSSPAGKPKASAHPGLLDAGALYCWQHKDQAQNTTIDTAVYGRSNRLGQRPIPGRTSLDSLVARLGVVSVTDQSEQKQKPENLQARQPAEPRKHDQPGRPMQASNSNVPSRRRSDRYLNEKFDTAPPRRPGFWASLCCMGGSQDDDYLEVVRHKHRVSQAANPQPHPQFTRPEEKPTQHAKPSTSPSGAPSMRKPIPNAPRPSPAVSSPAVPQRRPLGELSPPSSNMRASSTPDTRHLLSFIPRHLSPQKTSALLNELSKPISPRDEDGYIYIFWLTDSNTMPSEDMAASLLSPPNSRQRRPSDVMSEFSSRGRASNQDKKTIKLKIGRANNVHRRMNEWTRQCGYNLSLVRFYPYISSAHPSPAAPPARASLYPDPSRPAAGRQDSDQVKKVRHVHRVERLIHLELADVRVKKDCEQCGREHREWFEIEATENGVEAVDEIIKRWVRWGDTTARVA